VWSPDGRLIAAGAHGEREILVLGLDGTVRRTIHGYARAIAWQPVPLRR
jgi:hypothetical protein